MLDGFVEINIWIYLSWYMDVSKFTHGFFESNFFGTLFSLLSQTQAKCQSKCSLLSAISMENYIIFGTIWQWSLVFFFNTKSQLAVDLASRRMKIRVKNQTLIMVDIFDFRLFFCFLALDLLPPPSPMFVFNLKIGRERPPNSALPQTF